jgi:hypothetical protein
MLSESYQLVTYELYKLQKHNSIQSLLHVIASFYVESAGKNTVTCVWEENENLFHQSFSFTNRCTFY